MVAKSNYCLFISFGINCSLHDLSLGYIIIFKIFCKKLLYKIGITGITRNYITLLTIASPSLGATPAKDAKNVIK